MTDISTGETLFAEGKTKEAEKCFLDILKQNHNNKEAYNNLGVIAFRNQDIEKAISFFQKALEIDPFYKDAVLNFSDLLRSLNRLREALPLVKLALEREGEDRELCQLFDEMLKEKARHEKSEDVYLKQVAPEKVHLKAGLNICIISDFNIAGQLTMLMRAINKYSEHKARCIILHDDHFAYDKDIILDECNNDFDEAGEIVRKADFYHFGRYVFAFPGVDFKPLLNPRNCVIQYFGSFLRNNGIALNEWHHKTGIAAITGNDYTIAALLDRSFYHVDPYFTRFGDMEDKDIPLAEKPGGTIRIVAGSAGSPQKRYDLLQQAVKELQEQGLPVEAEVINGVPNSECLRRKQQSHITFTSLGGGWGLSGIESMWLGHAVMSTIDPFILSIYPDQPTVIVDKHTLTDRIKELVLCPEEIAEIGACSREFAQKHFTTRTIVKRYLYVYDLIMNHNLYLKGSVNAARVYSF